MTRFSVSIVPEAEAEIRAAYRWYFQRSPLAADAFRVEVFDRIDALAIDAGRWPRDPDGFQRRRLSRFPYTICYDRQGQQVTVLAVAHQRRSPGYWRDR